MRKILIVLLTLALLFSLPASYGEEAETYGTLMKSLGLINGYADGSLKEDGTITREEMVVVLNGISKNSKEFENFVPPTEATFKDIPVNHWAYKHVEFAYRNGITSGIGNDEFGAGLAINYNQAAIFFANTLSLDIEDIDYKTAADEIKKQHNLGLSETMAGDVQLVRGKVFELMAMTLDYKVSDDASKYIESVETISDENKTLFENTLPTLVEKKDNQELVVSGASLFKAPEKPTFTADEAKAKADGDVNYEKTLDRVNVIYELCLTFIEDNLSGEYVEVPMTDWKEILPENGLSFRVYQEFTPTGEYYFFSSNLMYTFKDDFTYDVFESSTEGMRDITGQIESVRQYTAKNGNIVYVLITTDNHQWLDTKTPGFVAFELNNEGEVLVTYGQNENVIGAWPANE